MRLAERHLEEIGVNMSKLFYKESKWQKVRDDNLLVYEKGALLNHKQADKLGIPYSTDHKYVQIQMQVSPEKNNNKIHEFLGYYNYTEGHHGEQFGLSHHPKEEYPLLAKYYNQIEATLKYR